MVLLIVIALLVNSCRTEPEGTVAEGLQPPGKPARAGIGNAGRQSAVLDADRRGQQVGPRRRGAGRPAAHQGTEASPTHAKELSVPSEMAGAQRNLLLAINFRVEGVTKIAALLPTALGGQGKEATEKIAGRHGDLPRLRRDLLAARRATDPADAHRERHPRAGRQPEPLPAEHRVARPGHGPRSDHAAGGRIGPDRHRAGHPRRFARVGERRRDVARNRNRRSTTSAAAATRRSR